MKRIIKKAAVIGSGVMGSRIACHFANVGLEVILLDIVPRELNDKEKSSGKTLQDKTVRNRIVNEALDAAIKSNPSPLYKKSYSSRIKTGNLEDDASLLQQCDWIIEAVTERLEIKQSVFSLVEQHRRPGTLITTNTSGIPIHLLLEGRSEDFCRHFCGTHFFNPPRYLKLLEIIPSEKTMPEIVFFFQDYGKKYLGKTVVLCKDTPAFIANRVGVFSIQYVFGLMSQMNLSVEAVDRLTGPILGRPKSATFRTCDVVGLDTLVHVANGIKENCPQDEAISTFNTLDYVAKMIQNNWIGDKSKQGFYKKTKNENGESEIRSLNLQTLEYQTQQKTKFATLESTKSIDQLEKRLPILYNGNDQAGEFYKKIHLALFAYVSHRIPEISDNLYSIDDAMKAGFGWQLGPFESWDIIGIEQCLNDAKSLGHSIAPWVADMIKAGIRSFYKIENGKKFYYDIQSQSYKIIPTPEKQITLSQIDDSKTVWSNSACILKDLGDGILCFSWTTKMNTIGGEVLQGLNKAIDIAESDYKGLVLYNDSENFSTGANVGMIFMLAVEQDFDELDLAVRLFQKTTMRLRYSSIPTVVAPHNLCLGGSCEMALHADKVIAHAETYMGLVEFGVGVIPGGGGTKEFALRCSDEMKDGDIKLNTFRNRFLTIGQAKVSTSGQEAFELGYLRSGIDEVMVSRDLQLARAKEACLEMFDNGYVQPVPRKDITILGQEALGIVYVGANTMKSGHYISDHDQFISEKLGFVLAGGDISSATQVSEQYLLDLERKTFIELCQQRKSVERMQSLVTSGKILRN
jgi:3-hydroxyacyl-CoA dehydrogenase